jgi:hypothetical protein
VARRGSATDAPLGESPQRVNEGRDVALAPAAVVDALVTRDRDLLEVGDGGVAVITPGELVERPADAP